MTLVSDTKVNVKSASVIPDDTNNRTSVQVLNGNWYVTGHQKITNEVIELNGNLILKSSTKKIRQQYC